MFNKFHLHSPKYFCKYITRPTRPILAFEKFIGDISKPPLVILHGLLGSRYNWRSLAKALTKYSNRTIFTVDARNHGESPHVEEMNYPIMGADLVSNLLSIDKMSGISYRGWRSRSRIFKNFFFNNIIVLTLKRPKK